MKTKNIKIASLLLAATLVPSLTMAGPIVSAANTAAESANVPASASATGFSSQQAQEIQQIVHDYLVSNPQVLVEASQVLQKRAEAQQQQMAQAAIQKNVQQIFNDPASPSAGNPADGMATVVEFFDYQCGHCKEMNSVVQQILKSNPKVRLVLKELPIFGGDSKYAATAALAAVKQGKYTAFHDALFSAANPLNKEKVLAVAKSVGLNTVALEKAMDDPAIKNELEANFKLAESLHVMGTPTFVIANKAQNQFRFIPGATSADNFNKLISEVSK